MARDEVMMRLVGADQEPITTFLGIHRIHPSLTLTQPHLPHSPQTHPYSSQLLLLLLLL